MRSKKQIIIPPDMPLFERLGENIKLARKISKPGAFTPRAIFGINTKTNAVIF